MCAEYSNAGIILRYTKSTLHTAWTRQIANLYSFGACRICSKCQRWQHHMITRYPHFVPKVSPLLWLCCRWLVTNKLDQVQLLGMDACQCMCGIYAYTPCGCSQMDAKVGIMVLHTLSVANQAHWIDTSSRITANISSKIHACRFLTQAADWREHFN
jgi:hypothetical protein